MNVQAANKSDHLLKITDFQILMAKETEDLDLDPEIVKKGVAAVFNDKSKGKYYVALNEKDEPIASLLTVTEWSDWRCKSILWIHSVYVIKDMRSQKVFKNMYLFLKDKVNKSEDLAGLRLYVDKSNTKAQKVYEALNMTKEHYHMYEWFK